MLTPFGKELRKLRIDREVRLGQLAYMIGISAAFLSAVETGRKKVPESMIKDVAVKLKLTGQEMTRLKRAAEESVVTVRIGLTGADTTSRALAVGFARKFPTLTDTQKRRIQKLILEDA